MEISFSLLENVFMNLVLFSITDAIRVIFSEGLEIIDFCCLWSPWGWTEDIAYFGRRPDINPWLAWRGEAVWWYCWSMSRAQVWKQFLEPEGTQLKWQVLIQAFILRAVNHCSNLQSSNLWEWWLVWLAFCKPCPTGTKDGLGEFWIFCHLLGANQEVYESLKSVREAHGFNSWALCLRSRIFLYQCLCSL